jgi:hypothetical protein
VDTWAFASALHVKFKDRFVGGGDGYDFLPLRTETRALPILSEWKSAKSLLSRVANAAAPLFGNQTPDLGAADLLRIRAGGVVPWAVREPTGWLSLALCIIPAPGAWLYAGGEAAVLPVGQLTLINRQALNSAVNLSNHPSITLVLDARTPDDPLGAVD